MSNRPAPPVEPLLSGATSSNVEQLAAVLAPMIAERLAVLLAAPAVEPTPPAVDAGRLLSAAELAERLGVARSYVYAHAVELGAVRIGSGAKPRLRFDPQTAGDAAARLAGGRSHRPDASTDAASPPRRRATARRMPNGLPKPGAVLTSRPRTGDSDAA